jgi:hypothetical protein
MTMLPSWCFAYGWTGFILACLFLLAALAGALVETWAIIKAKLKAAKDGPPAAVETLRAALVPGGLDPKLLEALKGLLEALKGLPAWISVFLAGLALLWVAGTAPELCKQLAKDKAGQSSPAAPGSGAVPKR